MSVAFVGTMAISLSLLTLATSAEVGDSWVTTLVLLQAPPVTSVITPSTIISAIIGGNVAEPQVVSVYRHACLESFFEGTSATRDVLGKSLLSRMVPIGTDVTTPPIINHSSIGILL